VIAKKLIVALVVLAMMAACSAQENTGVVAAGAQVKKLIGDFAFTEGPAADAQGNVYFTDIPANRILKWSVEEGKLSTFLENSGGANGLCFDKAGNLLVCQGGDRRIVSITPKGEVTVLADRYEGKNLNSPNDLWIDPNGGVYFTDPRYGNRDGMEQDGEHVYYLTPDRKKVIRVISDMVRPNGIIGTPNGRRLYVADHGANKTYSYRINGDGTLSDKQILTEQGSDGVTLDARGNLYLTGKAVTVYSRRGQKVAEIEVPEGPANVTFGGKDNQTLFITARTSLYSIPMAVRGARTPVRPDQPRGTREGRQRPRPR
jgi:gluconolactonase